MPINWPPARPPASSSPTPPPRCPPSRTYRPDTCSHTLGTRTRSRPLQRTRHVPLPGFCSSSLWPPPAASAAPSTSTTAPPSRSPLETDSHTACTTWRCRSSTPRVVARSGSFRGRTADRGTTRTWDSEMPWRPTQHRETGPSGTAGAALRRSSTGTAKEAAWTMSLVAWHSGGSNRRRPRRSLWTYFNMSGHHTVSEGATVWGVGCGVWGVDAPLGASENLERNKSRVATSRRFRGEPFRRILHHWVGIRIVLHEYEPIGGAHCGGHTRPCTPRNLGEFDLRRSTRPNVRSDEPCDAE